MLGMTSNLPLIAVQRWPGSRYQRVNVGMMLELLVSGVQHHQCGGLILAGSAKLSIESFPSGLKQ